MCASSTSADKILETFAAKVQKKFAAHAPGEPEAQIRAPVEAALEALGTHLGVNITVKDESALPDVGARPDQAVLRAGVLTGHVELKPPGTGARTSKFKGHNKAQWTRLKSHPNLLYTDGNEWALYREGSIAGKVVSFNGDISTDGAKAITSTAAVDLVELLREFFKWEPLVPKSAKQLAELLAPLCRMLRDSVMDALLGGSSKFRTLAGDWRKLLFPDASDEEFADAYAQTVTYALLLAQSEGADVLDIDKAAGALHPGHSLLGRALQILTDPTGVREEVQSPLDVLQRVISVVDAKMWEARGDPWLYFYEDFLNAYDKKLRRDSGVYYTPVEVVRAQVRMIHDLLEDRLGKPLGFADDGVVTLDPGVGTGSYLLVAIDHALSVVDAVEGTGAMPARASQLAQNTHGFEILVGPYAVSELRLTKRIKEAHGGLPKDGVHIYLTDTLESPFSSPPAPPLFLAPLAQEHERARHVKEHVPVIVCLGNPPYDRHLASEKKGGWVRYGDGHGTPILEDILQPARDAGYGEHLKNVYNLYVYFWRWALWKTFEQINANGPGIISLITAASYLDGPAFVGLRQHMRALLDEIWIIDLGGEGRGARQSDNVFVIQTPVAIAVGVRYGTPDAKTPAKVHFSRIDGSSADKLNALSDVSKLADLTWENCPDGWQDPFRPAGVGEYFTWPELTDVFPWQFSGVQTKRTWVIAPDEATLERRWKALLSSPQRAKDFRETAGGRLISKTYRDVRGEKTTAGPIDNLASDAKVPTVSRYGYRSFDRQCLLADGRVIDRPRPPLWRTIGDSQVFFTSLLTGLLGAGPAMTVTNLIPDLDHFRGSFGAKHVIPLWRDSSATHPNITNGILKTLEGAYGRSVTPEDLAAYMYALLAHPAFTELFGEELGHPPSRLPLTRDADLFDEAVEIGRHLVWLHTYGERWIPVGKKPGDLPGGTAKNVAPVSDKPDEYPEEFGYDLTTSVLRVGNGEFAPVSPEVWAFEVSGLRVVDSWLEYRTRRKPGKTATALDFIVPERWTPSFTAELLRLLWVLEATIALQPRQEDLLLRVVGADVIRAEELPSPTEEEREPPTGEDEFAADVGQETLGT